MEHDSDETLRRSLEAGAPCDGAHWQHCDACRARRDAMAANARFAETMFAGPAPALDVALAHDRLFDRRYSPRPWRKGVAALAAAAAVALALIFTPLGGRALALLTIFEPQQFVPLAISNRDAAQLRLVPYLRDFGVFRVTRSHERRVVDIAAARDALDFPPRTLSGVPSTLSPVRYVVVPPSATSFTFSAAKARAYEWRSRGPLPPMPRGLDGTTVRVDTGWALVTTYGEEPKGLRMARRHFPNALIFVQTHVPRGSSSGGTVAALESYFLSMPNVPPDVAAQLRAVADPATTLPVPFRIDKQRAATVDVDGTKGLAIGDETGLGASVMWQKGGLIYFLAGPLKETDILSLANALQ